MKKRLLSTEFLLFVAAVVFLTSCGITNDSDDNDEFLLYPDHYIAGTISSVESNRYSPYLIRFENDNVAYFISTTASFPGKYTFQGDTLFFQTDDLEKVTGFSIVNNEITDSHYEVRFYQEDGSYEPAPVKYTATGELGESPDNNQLAGKSFVGDQHRFGMEGVFQENFTYLFSDAEDTYGSGTENIDDQSHTYELFSNVAFRYQEGNTKEFGVLINNQLIVFRESGLFYWGTYSTP